MLRTLRNALARVFRPDSLPSREWTRLEAAAAIRSVTDMRTGERTCYTVQNVARDGKTGRVRTTRKFTSAAAAA